MQSTQWLDSSFFFVWKHVIRSNFNFLKPFLRYLPLNAEREKQCYDLLSDIQNTKESEKVVYLDKFSVITNILQVWMVFRKGKF